MLPKNARRAYPSHFDIEARRSEELIKELEAKGIKVDDLRLHGEGPATRFTSSTLAGIAWSCPKTRTRSGA